MLMALPGHMSSLRAEGIEISPFYGCRFGGSFFELVTNHPADLDVTPAVGLVLNVPLHEGLQIEGLFTHQKADLLAPAAPLGALRSWRIAVDHWLGGGLQEFGTGRVLPFTTGMVGLTRYAVDGSSEVRFTMTGGGGVKLLPSSNIGVRLDGRILATFIDAHGSALACAQGVCLLRLHTNIVWQAEFTAAVIARFP
jgi:hypothetical protein